MVPNEKEKKNNLIQSHLNSYHPNKNNSDNGFIKKIEKLR